MNRIWLAMLLATVPLLSAAETYYVTDILHLGLHRAPDTSDRSFRTLNSGQEMELISRERNYAFVRLPDGVQGFVKFNYLLTEKPAKLIVDETQAANAKLAKDLKDTKDAFSGSAARIASLEKQVGDGAATASETQSTLTLLEAENKGYRKRLQQYNYSLPWPWVLGAAVVCLLSGFLAGLWYIDQRSRKRHGGFRVY